MLNLTRIWSFDLIIFPKVVTLSEVSLSVFAFDRQKTKPTQHSVRELRALGLTPHVLACRSAQVCSYIYSMCYYMHLRDLM